MAGRFRWSTLLRFFAGMLLIGMLFRMVGLDALRAAAAPARAHPGWIGIALALTFAALLAGAVRWQVLLRALGLPAPFPRIFRGYFIGQFFNAFLFGACGGDLVRAVVAAHDHPERRPEAVTSVLLDRLIGLAITLVFGGAMVLARFGQLAGHAEARPALLLMAALLAAATALTGLLFARHLFDRSAWLKRWQHRGRIGPLVRRAYDAAYLFRNHARRLLWPAVLSLANLLLLAAATAALARALDLRLPFRDLLVAFPVITVLAAVPLTPGSLGVREGLTIQLLRPFGVTAGSALLLSLLGYLAGAFWSLAGGLLLLRGNPRPAPPEPDSRA